MNKFKPGDRFEMEHDCVHPDGYCVSQGERGIVVSDRLKDPLSTPYYNCVLDRHRSLAKISKIGAHQIRAIHPLRQLAEQA